MQLALSELRTWLRPRSRLIDGLQTAANRRLGLRPLQNWVTDLRFGGSAGGLMANPFAAQGASRVQSTDYAALSRMYRRNRIAIATTDVLVDVGCGRGRVINWWLGRGLRNHIVGLEIVPAVAAATARRLVQHPNVEILCGDAVDLIPPEGTFFYLYNPFDARVMRRFADALLESVEHPAKLRILYFNCRHVDAFRGDPRWRVEPLDSGGPEPASLIVPAG
ncbi:MAG TPA: class I SAM-dependent methyltransferase [Longimicrobium sp.]|nr:class I SAM-dependent methyltransferase [Longimicrobium sp.]